MNDTLRELIREIVRASSSYQRLEGDRELIQRNVIARIQKGYINNDRDLKRYLMNIADDPLMGKTKSYELAVTALMDIPFAIWSRIS